MISFEYTKSKLFTIESYFKWKKKIKAYFKEFLEAELLYDLIVLIEETIKITLKLFDILTKFCM